MPKIPRPSKADPAPEPVRPAPRRVMRLTSSPLAVLGQRAGFATAAERAAAVGISRSHLLHIERGAVRPSLEVVGRMAEAYHQAEGAIERAADTCQATLARRTIARIEGLTA